MVSLSDFRSRLQNRLFDSDIKSTLVVNKIATTTDKWGDLSSTTLESSTSVDAVLYDYNAARKQFESFGDFKNSNVIAVMPYDTTISSDNATNNEIYTVTYDSQTWRVVEVVEYPYGGGNLAYAVGLAREV